MKKIILIAAISIGLTFTVAAQRKSHSDHKSDSNRNSHTSSKSSHGHTSHKSSGHSSRSYSKGSSSRGSYSRGSSSRGSYNSGHGHSSHGHSSGHYEYVSRRVWVPGCSTRIWIPARYEYQRQSCGRVIRVCVSHGHYDTRYSQGRYEYKQVKVYRQGRSHHNSGLSVYWRF